MRSDRHVLIRFRPALYIATVALVVSVAGCGSNEEKGSTLTVFAASSLTGTFTELGQQFEAAHPGVRVRFNFSGSSDLVSQIQNGAPADVFASADTKNMDKVTAAHLEGAAPVVFASNTLEIITPPDNPGGVDSLDDLAENDLAVAVCAPEVPCGSAAREVAEAAAITLAPDTAEQSVKDVVAKVAAGEADAGLVYVTDARAAGDTVHGVVFPESAAAVNSYPITTIKASKNLDLATQFMDFVSSTGAQAVFAAAGFAAP